MNEVIQREEHISTADLAGRPRTTSEASAPLLPADFTQNLRSRWESIQTGFVDSPRTSVQQADELVASAIQQLAERFADERNNLERQWDRGDQVNTEDLRIALTKYRTFFHKLMSV
jgi:hypothetical protein